MFQNIVRFLAIFFFGFVSSSTFSPARPPSIPLAVRSPYLNTWLAVGGDEATGGHLAERWPRFYTGSINGWVGMIRVDGETYSWMGQPGPDPVTQVSVEYTSTKSVFTMNVNDMVEMRISFLSPIAPDDMKRQSLVFSYLEVEVAAADGSTHDVQLYADISAEWISGDLSALANWDYGAVDDVVYHKIFRQTELKYSESGDKADWGNWYWATGAADGVSYQSGEDNVVRGLFATSGFLESSADDNFRAINAQWPVFAFSHDLGAVGTHSQSVLYSIGLAQTDAIQFNGAGDVRPLKSLWTEYFGNELEALHFFHHDYSTASSMAASLDSKIEEDSISAAGENYMIITTLSTRQSFAATQLVGSLGQPYLFLKEISSNGNTQTVDVIFPAHPIFLYTNPYLLKLLLIPHFENQEAGKYPHDWAIHDLGTHYPNATGHPEGDDEHMPLEECGNMLIMMLAYAQKSGDWDFLADHYEMLVQWAEFLVDESLIPEHQLSTDDFAGKMANQTNLAVKGMIGLEAMSVIASATGHLEDADDYSAIAHDYIDQWLTLGIAHDESPPHTTLGYGLNDTYGLLYNIYEDAALGLDLVPDWVYDMQSSFYPFVEARYGVALDTRHDWTKGRYPTRILKPRLTGMPLARSDWEIFVAAVSSLETRNMLIGDIAKWINETTTDHPLTDLYDSKLGGYPGIMFTARPVMGAAFALLTMEGKAPVLQRQRASAA
ncbi:glutaminase GtaA [Lineolata rhizophorae]|uniref:Glutaminase GtaA n=1 Tax=Lineolata rhizophorae TaxID=578093 RepID=A0A6A6P3Y5_9PEZI|nr:glutaminase GtaA [Lineolata rhizophorae]